MDINGYHRECLQKNFSSEFECAVKTYKKYDYCDLEQRLGWEKYFGSCGLSNTIKRMCMSMK